MISDMIIKTTATKEEIKSKIFSSKFYKDLQKSLRLKDGTEVFIYNKYTFMANGDHTVTVIIEDYETYRLVHYIISGHKTGLLRIDFSINDSMYYQYSNQISESGIPYEIIEK